jgi:hypothetical protein
VELRDRHRLGTAFHVAMLVLGAVALGFVIDRLGWDGMRRVVVGTGRWFAVIAAIDLVSVLGDTLALHGFLDRAVAFRHVFAAEASGIAINRLTPGNSLGEPVKVTMLARHVATERAVAGVVMFNLATLYVGIAVIAVGVPTTALLLDLPRAAAVVAWGGLAGLVVLALGLALVVRRGALATLIGAIAGLRLVSARRAAGGRARSVDLDRQLRQLGDLGAPSIRRGLLGIALSRLANGTGTVVVLHAAGIAMTAPLVVAMLSVGILVTWISGVIPLGLGIADGTNYALYGVLGASPEAGLVFTMVGRVRTCVLAVLGLTVLAIAGLTFRRRG